MSELVCYNYNGNLQNNDRQTFNLASKGRTILKANIYKNNMNLYSLFDSDVSFQWKKCRLEIEEDMDYFAFLEYLTLEK